MIRVIGFNRTPQSSIYKNVPLFLIWMSSTLFLIVIILCYFLFALF